jgi:SAM-dependent methyltransferase
METLELAPAPYDGLAPAYDVLTARYRHDRWLAAIEQLALECGLRGRRVLDVACGTGKSFLPLLRRGYEVTACDVSPGMVAEAQRKAGGRATVYVADMRCLPPVGRFDLVTCLDDAINHLQSADEVLDALSGMYANLAPGGLLAFDVNTLAAYRATGDFAVEEGEHVVVWHGREAVLTAPGSQVRVLVDVFAHTDGDLWRRTTTEQCHRHYPLPEIERLLQLAGFQIAARRGQLPGVRLEPDPDENAHPKALFVARRPVTAEY